MIVTEKSVNSTQVAELLRNGGIIIYPTETVYGIGCWAQHPGAIERVTELKGISREAPFLVLIREKKQVAAFCSDIPLPAFNLIEYFWPGPLSLVMPAARDVHHRLVGASQGVGLRVSSHPLMQEILKEIEGGIVSSSANPTGEPPPVSMDKIDLGLMKAADLIINGGTLPGGSSTVLDLCQSPPMIVRQGVVTVPDIERVVGTVKLA